MKWARAVRVGLVAIGLVLVAGEASAQNQRVINIELGRISMDTLARISPSLYYRPFNQLTSRPDAAALGMGSAYLARSSNPLAVGWTPAGLAGVKELHLAADGSFASSTNSAEGFPETLSIPGLAPLFVTSFSDSWKGGLNYGALSLALPIWENTNQKVVGAFFWRRHTETTMPTEIIQDLTLDQVGATPITLAIDRSEQGGVEAFGPSFAFQVVPGVSLGVTGNFLTGRLRSTGSTNASNTGGGNQEGSFGRERFTLKYKGFSADLGAKFSLMDKIHVAGVFTPEYTLEVTGGQYSNQALAPPGQPIINTYAVLAGYDMKVASSFGGGIAVQPHRRLWIQADYSSQKYGETGLAWNGPLPDDGADPVLPLADVDQVNIGAELLVFDRSWGQIPVRGGWRSADQPYRQVSGDDYTYIYSYENPFLTPEEADAIQTFETIALLYDGSPSGKQVTADAYSFGASLRTGAFVYDFGADVMSLEEEKFFLDSPWDPIFNANPIEGFRRVRDLKTGEYLPPEVRNPSVIKLKRTISTFRLSATYEF